MELLSKEGATVQRERPVAKEGRSDCPEGRVATKGRKEGTRLSEGSKEAATIRRKQGRKERLLNIEIPVVLQS